MHEFKKVTLKIAEFPNWTFKPGDHPVSLDLSSATIAIVTSGATHVIPLQSKESIAYAMTILAKSEKSEIEALIHASPPKKVNSKNNPLAYVSRATLVTINLDKGCVNFYNQA